MKRVVWRKRTAAMHSGIVRLLRKYGRYRGIISETQGVHYCEFVDFIWYLMFVQHVGDGIFELVFMVAWCIWYNKNGSTRQLAQMVVQKNRMLIDEFQATNHFVTQWREESEVRWTLLVISNYKVNVDGATFAQCR